jgi:hypothetical protein
MRGNGYVELFGFQKLLWWQVDLNYEWCKPEKWVATIQVKSMYDKDAVFPRLLWSRSKAALVCNKSVFCKPWSQFILSYFIRVILKVIPSSAFFCFLGCRYSLHFVTPSLLVSIKSKKFDQTTNDFNVITWSISTLLLIWRGFRSWKF